MNKILSLTVFLITAMALFFISCSKSPKISFENPLQVEFGDPYIFSLWEILPFSASRL
jgi:hypothetical protein